MADRGLVWNGIQFFTCSEDVTLRYISSNCISSTLNVLMSYMSAEMQNLGWSSFGRNNIYAYSPNNIISVGGVSWTSGASIALSAGQYLEVVLEENTGYKLSGKWKVDEEYGWMVDDVINYGVSFNSGGVDYNYMRSYHWNDDAYLYYGTSPNSSDLTEVAHYDYDVGNNSWADFDKNSIVDFGSTEQEVGDIFYQWFTSTFSQYQEPAAPIQAPDWANCFVKTTNGNKAVEKVWIKQNGQLVTVYEAQTPAPSPVSFATDSWETISAACKDGSYKTVYSVGDTKDITLSTGETITVAIMGFDHDDLSDGSGKAPITVAMENLLATLYPMNPTNTNTGGWDECEMRTSTMVTLLSQLPSDLQSVIKQVNKKAVADSLGKNITTSADKLWLFALAEIFSATSIENSSDLIIPEHAKDYIKEGTQYEYYENLIGDNDGGTDANPLLIKKVSNGSGYARAWWLRSLPFTRNYFHYIGATGKVSKYNANNTYGVCFGFCIG